MALLISRDRGPRTFGGNIIKTGTYSCRLARSRVHVDLMNYFALKK